MSILIDKVRIKNFRSLKDVEINLHQTTILVGGNNSGKTTFLQALNIALGVNKKLLTKDDLFIDKDANQVDDTIIIDIRIIPVSPLMVRIDEFDAQWLPIFGSDAQFEGTQSFFAFRTEIKFKSDGDRYDVNHYFITNWSNPDIKESDKLTSSIHKAILVYFLDAQRDLEQDVKLRNSFFGKLATQLDKNYDAENLTTIKRLVSELNSTAVDNSEVLSHLKEELSKLNQTTQTTGEGVSISPFPMKIRDLHKGMKVNFQDNGSDIFSLEYHGMGTRSWASILSFSAFIAWESKQKIANSEAYFPILALEEPEAHLHPNAQRTLYKQLKNITGQKIISTHSPYVVGQAGLEELIFFKKDQDIARISVIEDLEILKEHQKTSLSRFVIDMRGEILYSSLVVLVEGETEERCLNIIANKYFDNNVSGLGINIIGCGGSNYKYFIRMLQAANIPFFVFSDYDNASTRTKVNSQLAECGYDPTTCNELIDLGVDIEDYLIGAGYENELKQAAQAFILIWFSRADMQQRKSSEIANTEGLRVFLKKYKTKLAPMYGTIIAALEDERCYPPKIKELFEKVNAQL